MAAVVLSLGRAAGETMAILMVAGNVAVIPTSILDPLRTLTANVALEMGYAFGDHTRALFASGVLLLLIVMLLNTFLYLLPKRTGT
jgi:phosphate transport system permease protein